MIHRAVIPVAGKGTRMAPISSGPKALLPLGGRTVLTYLLDEAAHAGLQEVVLVVSPATRGEFEAYLAAESLAMRLALVDQPTAGGLGDAVACAEPLIGGEPFVVLLGDHVRPSGAQGLVALMAMFESLQASWCAGMQRIDASQLGSCGVAAGEPLAGHEDTYRCTQLIEKPEASRARQLLKTPDLSADTYLAHNGQYVFSPAVFDALRHVRVALPVGKELGLTAAQQAMLADTPDRCYLRYVDGPVWDTGNPAGYEMARRQAGESDCQDCPPPL